MPLSLRTVHSDTDFNALIQLEHLSYTNPPNRIWRLFRHDASPAGFIEVRDRQMREFRNDPTARWLKVVDTDIGDQVVGAALWNTYTENPYPVYEEHPVEADWWPEDLPFLFVHPEHRRRGIGRQLVDWGVKEADRLNLEAFIEATDLGKVTYEACGFVYAGTNYLESAKRNSSQKWRELEAFMDFLFV
ncbi:uncharacterized protein KY384_000414 [Bacidia gigantensis]|uniref:uncharacterized protein n=1 Tax=Bacidia gigantensis TaxID=2732470 RepID=UPI001D03F2DD|nr:uncharacterized protein KY384_000414 [Bacidia gigantensis]KAG8525654.1 hypothetical protein KY384_000414 [Bacidia gigantensis]